MKPNPSLEMVIPYSTHVADDVIRLVGGEYLIAWKLDGFADEGVDPEILEHRHEVLNRWMQSLRAPDSSNVAVWTHLLRRKVELNGVDDSHGGFQGYMALAHDAKLKIRSIFENQLFFTLIYRPGKDRSGTKSAIAAAVKTLRELGASMEQVFGKDAPRRLRAFGYGNGTRSSELVRYLGSLVNGMAEDLPLVNAPLHCTLATGEIKFAADGSEWQLQLPNGETSYGAMLGIKDFPETTRAGQFNLLRALPFEFTLTQSFSPLGTYQAMVLLERTKGRLISSGDHATSQIQDLDVAMDQLSSGKVQFGEYHFSLAVHAQGRGQLLRHIAMARSALTECGVVCVREGKGTPAGYFAQLPGNWKYRPRVSVLSSRNFVGLSPLFGVDPGKSIGNPWGEAITRLRTRGDGLFHFNFHETPRGIDSAGDMSLGNTLVLGKSGSGKTALVNFLLGMTLLRARPPRLFVFDKDRGAELFVRAMGGIHFALRSGIPTGINPLQMPNLPGRLAFLVDWICSLVGRETLMPAEEAELEQALLAILDAAPELRTLSNLRRSLPNHGDECMYAQLRKWTRGQGLGWVFDMAEDRLAIDDCAVFAFDYTEIMDDATLRVPVIQYLIFRLETLLNGDPLIYVMDEFWKILEGESGLREFAKNKQKTIRKQNGLGIFATQSPEDALASPIAAAIVEQTATLILLPNPAASREDYIEGLKLTEAEYDLVKNLSSHAHEFIVKQGGRCTVCTLDLSGLDDIFGGAVIECSKCHTVRVLAGFRPVDHDGLPRLASVTDRNSNPRLLISLTGGFMKSFRFPIKAIVLTSILGLPVTGVSGGMPVHDGVHTLQNILTQLHNGSLSAAEFAREAARWAQQNQHNLAQLQHITRQLIQVQRFTNFRANSLVALQERDPTEGVDKQCSAGRNGVVNYLASAIQSPLNASLADQQRTICQQVAVARNLQFNNSVRLLQRLRARGQQFEGIENARLSVGDRTGDLATNSNDVDRFMAAAASDMSEWQSVNDSYEKYVQILRSYSAGLSRQALQGRNSVIGGFVQAQALKSALQRAKR